MLDDNCTLPLRPRVEIGPKDELSFPKHGSRKRTAGELVSLFLLLYANGRWRRSGYEKRKLRSLRSTAPAWRLDDERPRRRAAGPRVCSMQRGAGPKRGRSQSDKSRPALSGCAMRLPFPSGSIEEPVRLSTMAAYRVEERSALNSVDYRLFFSESLAGGRESRSLPRRRLVGRVTGAQASLGGILPVPAVL